MKTESGAWVKASYKSNMYPSHLLSSPELSNGASQPSRLLLPPSFYGKLHVLCLSPFFLFPSLTLVLSYKDWLEKTKTGEKDDSDEEDQPAAGRGRGQKGRRGAQMPAFGPKGPRGNSRHTSESGHWFSY